MNEVARNEEVANSLVADQAAQQAAAAAAAAQAAADQNQSVYGTLGEVGPGNWSTEFVSSGYGSTGVTGAGTPGLGTGDYGVTAGGSQLASTTSTGEQGAETEDQGRTDVAQSETLSDLPVTEVASAPAIFDLASLSVTPGAATTESADYLSDRSGGGGETLAFLTDEERLLAMNIAQAKEQQASVAPTVTPVQYDLSKFITGIGSLATSKQA